MRNPTRRPDCDECWTAIGWTRLIKLTTLRRRVLCATCALHAAKAKSAEQAEYDRISRQIDAMPDEVDR